MKYLNKLINKLNKSPLKVSTFRKLLGDSEKFFDNIDLEIELLISNGFPLDIKDDFVYLKTSHTTIKNQIFCIVDIETTTGKASDGQIIEIGAIKYQNGEIIDKYESLVNATLISEHIQKLTGITYEILVDAPLLRTVLEEFKIFLEDSLFVSHSINFDYKFISDSFIKHDLGKMFNRKLCTIDISKRIIATEKYGLQYLKEFLNINITNHHRAYSDALSSMMILEKCLQDLPKYVNTAEELIKYSKSDNLKVIKKDIKNENII
jgi:DNA polymerase-3 subunit epsilon